MVGEEGETREDGAPEEEDSCETLGVSADSEADQMVEDGKDGSTVDKEEDSKSDVTEVF